jgi:hypothetical protein
MKPLVEELPIEKKVEVEEKSKIAPVFTIERNSMYKQLLIRSSKNISFKVVDSSSDEVVAEGKTNLNGDCIVIVPYMSHSFVVLAV